MIRLKFSILNIFLFSLSATYAQHDFRIYEINSGEEITDYTLDLNWARHLNVIIETGSKKYYFHHPGYEYKYTYIYLDTLHDTECVRYSEVDKTTSVGTKSPKDSTCAYYQIYRACLEKDISPRSEFEYKNFITPDDMDFMIGGLTGFSHHSFTAGLQVKYYALAFWFYPSSITLQWERMLSGDNKELYSYGVTGRFLPIGIGLHYLSDGEAYNLYLRPEFGFDIGVLSLHYGYDIPLSNQLDLSDKRNHTVNLGLALNISSPIRNLHRRFQWLP